MCCPGINASWRSSQDACSEESLALNGISKQPGSSSEFHLKIGDPSLLDTIRAAGDLVSDALNSARIQRTSQFCQDSCRPWCADSCWSPCLCFFDCLCACMITPEDQAGSQEKQDELSEFIQNQREMFGPICVGIAMKNGPWDVSKLLAEGHTLSEEQKQLFSEKCQEAKEQLGKCLKGGSQQELFKIANASHHLPSKGSTEIENVKKSREEFTSSKTPPSLPTCLILYPAENAEGASNEQRSGYTLNLQRLQQQLSQLEVVDLNSSETSCLGFQSREAVSILIFTLNKYVDEAKNTFDSPGFGLTLEESKYRILLLLSLLSLGFAPIGADQELPTCLEQLQNTSKELYKQEKNAPKTSIDTRSLIGTEVRVSSGSGFTLPKYGQRSIISGRIPACANSDAEESCVDGVVHDTMNNAELWDPTNPKSQEALLKMAKNITAMTSSLFLR
ncbi:hypothetical protein [Chlamydia felis Fe/C-56]|uniref:Uncharacterized protein n=1 Tax=Chlamydia felis (strain Fe/C-56) TaxID=264202 RepID=Q253R0_CHLFF|nr:hypothetical protein [Chlamydia felis]BAE81478.1 hypothetical protein [Chlamydia felis Fe/C-56]